MPFIFKGNIEKPRTESSSFRKTVDILIEFLTKVQFPLGVSNLNDSFLFNYLKGKSFKFYYNPKNNISKRIEFLPDGTIGLGQNQNEYRWIVKNDKLIIFNDKNQVYSRFYYDSEYDRLNNTNDSDTLSLRNQFMKRL